MGENDCSDSSDGGERELGDGQRFWGIDWGCLLNRNKQCRGGECVCGVGLLGTGKSMICVGPGGAKLN